MTNLIFGYDSWAKKYSESTREKKYNIWIYAKLSNSKEIYLEEYKHWQDLKKYCYDNVLNIEIIGLRYRSHQIEKVVDCSEAVYVVRSVKGEFGATTKQCYTIGLLKDNKVEKTMWITPELVEESSFIDNKEDCFEEAFIYQNGKKE
jgi:hypothetical protein